MVEQSSDGEQNRSILFVDDQTHLTTMVSKIYRDIWDVHVANNRQECIEVLSKHKIGVVISDYYMPDVDGITLLAEIRENDPKIRRILLSGNIDVEMKLEGYEKAEIHKVMKKPWSRDEFIKEINSQLSEYNNS